MCYKTSLIACVMILSMLLCVGTASAETVSGYISELAPEGSEFEVHAGDDTFVEVTFTYPKGDVDFWVASQTFINGESYTLGPVDLDDGNIIQLEGGGTFIIYVFSNAGFGPWSAEYHVDSNGACDCPKWPDQSMRYLTEAELRCCSCEELEILRNEIYARHGRVFNRDDLQNYFESQSWYVADPSNPTGADGRNKYEIENASFILEKEEAWGCR